VYGNDVTLPDAVDPNSITIEVGDTVTFGTYNGVPITWKVLKMENSRALIISEHVLAQVNFNNKNADITWEDSEIRNWLNNDFLASSFNELQRLAIFETEIVQSNNPDYGVSGGNNTKDKIFLLSTDEARDLFITNEERKATMDGLAMKWWLRSPGVEGKFIAIVLYDGAVYSFGANANGDTVYNCGVRPALWADIMSLQTASAQAAKVEAESNATGTDATGNPTGTDAAGTDTSGNDQTTGAQ
jgi:hypothetical protein